jgi:hypothetical protein
MSIVSSIHNFSLSLSLSLSLSHTHTPTHTPQIILGTYNLAICGGGGVSILYERFSQKLMRFNTAGCGTGEWHNHC